MRWKSSVQQQQNWDGELNSHIVRDPYSPEPVTKVWKRDQEGSKSRTSRVTKIETVLYRGTRIWCGTVFVICNWMVCQNRYEPRTFGQRCTHSDVPVVCKHGVFWICIYSPILVITHFNIFSTFRDDFWRIELSPRGWKVGLPPPPPPTVSCILVHPQCGFFFRFVRLTFFELH
jgi:hypothetical protein